MWFSSRAHGRGYAYGSARGALLVATLFMLAACGFQPLYRPVEPEARTPADEMATVRITPLPDRQGQQMHNFLRDRLNPRGQPSDPAYVLRVGLSEARRELGIRKDETATRANLIMRANFDLRRSGTGEVLLKGVATSTNSYNVLTNQFATIVAEDDARARGLRELADIIRTRLAIYFSQARAAAP